MNPVSDFWASFSHQDGCFEVTFEHLFHRDWFYDCLSKCFLFVISDENGILVLVLRKESPCRQPNVADEEWNKNHLVKTIHIWTVQQMAQGERLRAVRDHVSSPVQMKCTIPIPAEDRLDVDKRVREIHRMFFSRLHLATCQGH
jgi:hypothetical protein